VAGGARGVMLGRWTAAAGRHGRRGRLLSLAQCAREREAGGWWPSGPRAVWPVGRDPL
jgi:hypothetical protein